MILKVLLTAAIVMTLSLIAEHVRPRVAGILAGFPLGFAIVLYFYGLEQGAAFAAASAVYTIAGFISILSFVGAYYLVSRRVHGPAAVILAPLAGFAAFLAASALIRPLPLGLAGAAVLALSGIVAFNLAFRHIENTVITHRAHFGIRLIAVRALLSAVVVLVITGIARAVGEQWAGLFSAFPTTLLPLLLIIHLTYGSTHVHTIIKNFPRGVGSTLVYLPIIHWLYPVAGIHWGTAAAMLVSAAYSTAAVMLGSRR